MSSIEEKFGLMMKLQNRLNEDLGDIWWSKYVAGAFWSNISTPINLAITLLSAVTAGQATTQTMLSPQIFFKISVASLLISTLNTFFRPHTQLMTNMTAIKSINEFGAKFETIYYSENSTEQDFLRRYNEYKKLSQDYNKFLIEETPEQKNFVTDFIYWIFKSYFCLKNNYKWFSGDLSYNDKIDYTSRPKPTKENNKEQIKEETKIESNNNNVNVNVNVNDNVNVNTGDIENSS